MGRMPPQHSSRRSCRRRPCRPCRRRRVPLCTLFRQGVPQAQARPPPRLSGLGHLLVCERRRRRAQAPQPSASQALCILRLAALYTLAAPTQTQGKVSPARGGCNCHSNILALFRQRRQGGGVQMRQRSVSNIAIIAGRRVRPQGEEGAPARESRNAAHDLLLLEPSCASACACPAPHAHHTTAGSHGAMRRLPVMLPPVCLRWPRGPDVAHPHGRRGPSRRRLHRPHFV